MNVHFIYIYVYLCLFCVIFLQVETCQEKIISLELEDPKSLESPTTPTTEQFIQTQLQQRLSASEDSDENQSFVTVCPNYGDETRVILHATDPEDYMNANVFVKQNVGVIEGRTSSNLQTIVEVVNPMLCGDGIATEITIGRSDDSTFASFEADNEAEDNNDNDDNDDGVVVLRKKSGFELSINDKMKNVLKELKQNEKVRLSLSRSMDGEDDDEEDEEEEDDDEESKDDSEEASEGHYNASVSYEEKTGANGTVFLVRERLINDFYDHEDKPNGDGNAMQTTTQTFYDEHSDLVDNCQVFTNPIVEDFLQHEIHHSEADVPASNESTKSRKESMQLELNQDKENDDAADEDDDNNDETPTTPTKSLETTTTAAGNKRKKRKSKNKKK